MPIDLLHHFTLVTDNIEKTSQFLKEALGFTDGYTPKVDFPLTWLYCGDQPVVHLVGKESPGPAGGGRIDHIAFNCSDYPTVKARLDQKGATQTEQSQPDVGVHQIFLETPKGIWRDLVFDYQKHLKETKLQKLKKH